MRSVVRPIALAAVAFIAGALLNPFAGDGARRSDPPNTDPSPAAPTTAPHRAKLPTPNEESAIATAVAFVCNGQQLLDSTSADAEELIRQVVVPDTADAHVNRILGDLDALRRVLADGTGPIVYRQSAVAWRVESIDARRARVAIWNVGVLTRAGVAPPQASWAISTVDLAWRRDRWMVVDERVVPGPAPILSDTAAPATASQLTAALDGFIDFGRGTR